MKKIPLNNSAVAGFVEQGRRYTVISPHFMDAADSYLFNHKLFIHIDHRGRCDAGFLQPDTTRYSLPFRYFFVRDDLTGTYWSAPFDPVQAEPEEFEYSPGLADIKWRNLTDGIEVRLQLIVPPEDTVEIWNMDVRNVSGHSRKISLFSCMPVGELCWMTHGSHFDTALPGMLFKYFPYYSALEDYPRLAKLKNSVFCLSQTKPDAWELSYKAFLGQGLIHNPAGLRLKKLPCADAPSASTAAVFQYILALPKGKAWSGRLLFGPGQERTEAVKLRKKYLSPPGAQRALELANKPFGEYEKYLQIETPDTELNAVVNHWLAKQAAYCGGTARMCNSPQIRNFLQDLMGYSCFAPEMVRRSLPLAFKSQHANGEMPMAFKLDERILLRGVYTSPHKDLNVWAPPVLHFYLAETGDFSLLDKKVPFGNSAKVASLYDHVGLGLDWQLGDRTRRGLSRIGRGDWTDPLDMAGYKGRGESVWLTEALVYALDIWAAVAEYRGEAKRAVRYRKEAARSRAAINRLAWDGRWYARGFTDAGRPFGVSRDSEGRIDLNAQSWAFMCGAADAQWTNSCMRAVREILETPSGPMLIAPAYSGMKNDIGRVTIKNPGHTENGSVYSHAAAFYAFGLYAVQQPEEAFRVLRRLIPGWAGNTLARAAQLPIYLPNYYCGTAAGREAGRASHGVGTGTVAWVLRTVLTCLLGVRGELDGLRIDPQLPKAWEGARLRRRWRNADFDIRITKSRSVSKLTVAWNGKVMQGHLIPPQQSGSRHDILVTIPVN